MHKTKCRTGQAEQDRQNGTGGTGQAKQYRQNGISRTGQSEQDRKQNGTSRTGQTESNGSTGQQNGQAYRTSRTRQVK